MTTMPLKPSITLSILFLFAISLFAQPDAAGLTALSEGDYQAAEAILLSQSEKRKTEVIGHFGLAHLYADPAAPSYDLDKANTHADTANELLREVRKRKDKEELRDIGVSTRPLRELRERIARQAIARAAGEDSPSAWEKVLDEFRLSPATKDTVRQRYGAAVVIQVAAAPDATAANNTLETYQRPLNRYHSDSYARGEAAVLSQFVGKHGWEQFETFRNDFSRNRFARDDQAPAFIPLAGSGSLDDFQAFAEEYPYSAFTMLALDSVARLQTKLTADLTRLSAELDSADSYAGLAQLMESYRRQLPQRMFWEKRYELEQKLVKAYMRENGWQSFPQFQEAHPTCLFARDAAGSAYAAIAESENLEAFRSFAGEHPRSLYQPFAEAEVERLSGLRTDLTRRAQVALEEFRSAGDLYQFHDKYRSDYQSYAPRLNDTLDRRVLDYYFAGHPVAGFEEFRAAYPHSAFALDTAAAAFLSIAGSKKLAAFEAFVKKHPASPFAAVALDSVAHWQAYRRALGAEVKAALREAKTYEATREFDRRYRQRIADFAPALQEQVDDKLLRHYVTEKGIERLDRFQAAHPDNKAWDEREIEAFTGLLGSGNLPRFRRFSDRYPYSVFDEIVEDSIRGLEARSTYSQMNFAGLQAKLRADLRVKNWAVAVKIMEEAERHYSGELRPFENLLTTLRMPERDIASRSMSDRINQEGSVYIPIVTADSRKLYFCGKQRPDNLGLEDIFISELTAGEWAEPAVVEDLSTPGNNEAPLSISADGNTLLLFVSGKLGYSRKTADGWSKPQMFSNNINIGRWQADATITADGKAMLFVHGDGDEYNDIYLSFRQADESWGPAKKLSDQINTPANERTPFLHPDMKTLYFSSSGHGSLGDLDVYVSTRTGKGWDEWSPPRNLGKEINTVGSDWGYKVSTDGSKAYFAARTGFNNKLFEVDLPDEVRPDRVTTVTGTVEGLADDESATIIVTDSETREEIARVTTEPGTGRYFVVVPKGIKPKFEVDKEGVYAQTVELDTVGIDKEETVNLRQDMRVTDFNRKDIGDLTITFQDVLFDTDQHTIREEMKPELDKIAVILKERDLPTNISGHTDDVGAADYNLGLSQRRAEAVKAYLVSRGCQADRITTAGFGETSPVDSNETEEGRARNRRVEFSFKNLETGK